ncbi:right-handed parallel beta-helix repeat-containing protein [Candidatus Omnitrophota bacterium]
MLKKSLFIFTLLCVLLVYLGIADAATWNVPGDFDTIQEAIDASSDGDVVVVSSGEYESITFGDVAITVESTGPGVATISGTAPVAVTFTPTAKISILDGFTITGGTQSGIYINDASPTIRNNIIINNSAPIDGGGIMTVNSSAVISNNIISDNSATEDGGGIYISAGAPLIEWNTITDNHVGVGGGAIAMNSATPEIKRNIFARNTAIGGSALYVQSSSPWVQNNTFTENTTGAGNFGTIYIESLTSMTLINSILYDNDGPDSPEIYESSLVGDTEYSYSLIEGTYDHDYAGDGILDYPGVDPLFRDSAHGDYYLQLGSPCIDTGHPGSQYDDPDGTPNDMGALYHSQSEGTGICGDVGGQTWTTEGSPYIVTCDIYVPEDTTLTIEPGVEVRFDLGALGALALEVHGTLHAVGTPAERILFTSNREHPDYWNWEWIHFHDTSVDSVIEHATIEYGGYGISCEETQSSSIRISNSIIHRNGLGMAARGNVEIHSNTITHNGFTGIYIFGGSPSIRNNIITENGSHGIVTFNATPTLSHNDVWGNGNGANYVNTSPGTGDISIDPEFINPAEGNYHLPDFDSPCIDKGHPYEGHPDDDYSLEPYFHGNRRNMGAYGNTPEAARSESTDGSSYPCGDVGGQIWTQTGNPYIVVCDIHVPEDTTLTIEPGVEVRFHKGPWGALALEVHGTLHAVGTPAERILFTSNREHPDYWNWEWIHFHDTSVDSVIEHATIEYGGYGISCEETQSSSIRISNSIIHRNGLGMAARGNVEIHSNTITHNGFTGIYIFGGSPSIRNNIITENGSHGIVTFNATPTLSHNDVWGNGNGANYVNTSPGTGDISIDPEFINPAEGNYHLPDFDSPCIDKGHPYEGHPDDDYSLEPYFHGNRRNMGAYGNTPEAARTRIIIQPCFLPGTPILMSDGTQKPIEQVKVGDTVLAFDEETGEFKEDKVVEFFQHPAEEYLIINEYLKVTKNHPVYSNGKWVEIGSLTIGDELFNRDSKPVRITSIKEVKEPTQVYNLEVNPYHTYVAGGIVAHNKPPLVNAASYRH